MVINAYSEFRLLTDMLLDSLHARAFVIVTTRNPRAPVISRLGYAPHPPVMTPLKIVTAC